MNINIKNAQLAFNRIRKMPKPLLPAAQLVQDLKLVGKGSFLSISGSIYSVETKHRYESTWENKTNTWYELKLVHLRNGNIFFLEWEFDDELEVVMWQKDNTLDFVSLSASKLERFDDEEKGTFKYSDDKYSYEDSGDAVFFKNCEGSGERYYYYDFECLDDDNLLISAECWEDSKYVVSTGETLSPEDVIILVLGGANATN